MLFFWISAALGGGAISDVKTTQTESIAPELACPDSVTLLSLPNAISANDPRLHSKHLVVVLKAARTVMRMRAGRLLHLQGKPACWKAGLGFTPTGHKTIEGDGKTPEGFYKSSDKPTSSFYAAIAVHYPNVDDASAAVQDGRITEATQSQIVQSINANLKPPQKTAMGGEILIHGGGSASDWTLGCVAMNNLDIDALRATLPESMVTDVLILP